MLRNITNADASRTRGGAVVDVPLNIANLRAHLCGVFTHPTAGYGWDTLWQLSGGGGGNWVVGQLAEQADQPNKRVKIVITRKMSSRAELQRRNWGYSRYEGWQGKKGKPVSRECCSKQDKARVDHPGPRVGCIDGTLIRLSAIRAALMQVSNLE